MKLGAFARFAAVLVAVAVSSGCQRATYPEEKIVSSIQEICRKEYKIEDVQIKFSGKTIGVFLPLKRLFAGDIRQALLSGNLSDPQMLFSPEAMDQLEDVFVATSRVFLSSDKEIDFYVLQATDVETTGFQLVLTGYVPDVRRLRLWDIPRSEYRKRVLHELKHSRPALWHKPVRELFKQAPGVDAGELVERYFAVPPELGTVSPVFYHFLTSLGEKQNLELEIKTIKSHPAGDQQALVYVQVVETYEPRPGISPASFLYPSGVGLEYVFILGLVGEQFKIMQVISLNDVDESGNLRTLGFPPHLGAYQDLNSWSEEFEVEEVNLGEFLARQLNRRAQELLISDERVRHTLKRVQFNYAYYHSQERLRQANGKPYFAFHFDFRSKAMKKMPQSVAQVIRDEDVLYVLDLVLRDFVDLVRSYRFDDFAHFQLVWGVPEQASSFLLELSRLELFRRKKLDISGLLESPLRSAPHSLF